MRFWRAKFVFWVLWVFGGVQAVNACSQADLVGLDITNPHVFDPKFYLFYQANQDLRRPGSKVRSSLQEIEKHWKEWGVCEGRRASPEFDARAYLRMHADVRAAYGNNYAKAMRHYLEHGRKEGRRGADCASYPRSFVLNQNIPETGMLGVMCTSRKFHENTQWITFDFIGSPGTFKDGGGSVHHFGVLGRSASTSYEYYRKGVTGHSNDGLGLIFVPRAYWGGLNYQGAYGERVNTASFPDIDEASLLGNPGYQHIPNGSFVQKKPMNLRIRDLIRYRVAMHINGDGLSYVVTDTSTGLFEKGFWDAKVEYGDQQKYRVREGSTGLVFFVIKNYQGPFEIKIENLRYGWF